MKHGIVAVVLDAGTDAGLATAHSLLADWLMPVGMNGIVAGELAKVSVAAAETAATVKTAAAIWRALRNVRSNLWP